MSELKTNEKRRTWTARMRCVVTKVVTLENCTEAQARSDPWEFATDEQEVDQRDWDIEELKADE